MMLWCWLRLTKPSNEHWYVYQHVPSYSKRDTLSPFEWLFSSSTFFTFSYILPDWLFDFFPSSTKRDGKIYRQIFVEWLWPLTFLTKKNVDDGNSHSNGPIEPMLVSCWSTVCDAGPTLNQHWFNVCWDTLPRKASINTLLYPAINYISKPSQYPLPSKHKTCL